jgi:hypothetical protein
LVIVSMMIMIRPWEAGELERAVRPCHYHDFIYPRLTRTTTTTTTTTTTNGANASFHRLLLAAALRCLLACLHFRPRAFNDDSRRRRRRGLQCFATSNASQRKRRRHVALLFLEK